MRRPSIKLHPFKLLVLILYGDYTTSLEWTATARCRLRIGHFAGLMSVANPRLKEYLEELQRMRYIGGLQFEWGYATFRVIPPPPQRLGYRDERS